MTACGALAPGVSALAEHISKSRSDLQLGSSERWRSRNRARTSRSEPLESSKRVLWRPQSRSEKRGSVPPNSCSLGLVLNTCPRSANTGLSRWVIALRSCCGLARRLTALERGHEPHRTRPFPVEARTGQHPFRLPGPSASSRPVSQPPVCRALPAPTSRPQHYSRIAGAQSPDGENWRSP
jgi:hypothetical protein